MKLIRQADGTIAAVDGDDDDEKVAKDGEVVRVAMTMMDSLDPLQRAVAEQAARDEAQRADDSRQAFGDALAAWATQPHVLAYNARIRDAWKGTAAAAPTPPSAPASPPASFDDAMEQWRAASASAQSEYDNRISNAWRA